MLNSSDSHALWYFCLGSVHLSNCFAELRRHTHCTLLHTAHFAHFAPKMYRCKGFVDVVHWIFIKFVREQIITCSKLLTPPRQEWWANMDFSVSFFKLRYFLHWNITASARTVGSSFKEPFKMTEIGFKKRVDKSNTRRGVGRKAREKILICTTGVAGRL